MKLSIILKEALEFIHFHPSWPLELKALFTDSCYVVPNFASMSEEAALLSEIEPHMKRLRYETAHWDDQITLYREREQREWSEQNGKIIKRMTEASFPNSSRVSTHVHILDLHKNGYIKPHIDSTRYCGDTISGLSLLSDSVMRLRKKNERMELIVDLLLLRRSLYRLVGIARHDFKHEILAENESRFKEVQVPRERRVSVIIRELPNREFAESDFLLKGQLSPE